MGKGSSPRNCFSREFRDNFDVIDWSVTKQEPVERQSTIEGMIRQSTDNPIKVDREVVLPTEGENDSCANE
jgi:hypothetical protein